MHTLALTTEGLVFSWGSNDDGALGRSGPENIPQMIMVGLKTLISDITAGDSHSIAYNPNVGTVYMWGRYRNVEHGDVMEPITHPQPIGELEFRRMKVQKIVSGAHHTLYLVNNRIYASGDAENLNLGPHARPTPRLKSPSVEIILIDKGWDKTLNIFAGSYHSFAIKEHGGLYAWGHNNYGQLGTGDFQSSWEMRKVIEIKADVIRAISGGETHTVALKDSGEVFAWGRNDDNQLGFDQETVQKIEEAGLTKKWPGKCCPFPTKIKGIEGVAKISAGANYTYAIDGLWQLHSWGMGENYVLGTKNDDNVEEPKHVLKEFSNKNRVIEIATGGQHVMILTGSPQVMNPKIRNLGNEETKAKRRAITLVK